MSSARQPDPRPAAGATAARHAPDGSAALASGSSLLRAAARRFEACVRDWDGSQHAPRLARALHLHRQLWSELAFELAAAPVGLPAGLRQDLLRVARFIDVWTAEVLAHPEPARLRGMIEIDRGIATLLASLPHEPRMDADELGEAA